MLEEMKISQTTANFSGDRLRIARYRAGLNIRELADIVDLSQAAISQYETGRAKPNIAAMAKLAMATGVPSEFLTFGQRTVSMAGLDGTHFRSLRSTSKQHRANAWTWSEMVLDVVEVLETYVRFPETRVPEFTLSPSAPREQVREAADTVRAAWGLPDGPVGHLVRHIEKNGIIVSRMQVVDDGIDAFSQFQSSRPVVILGTNKGDAARSRFDAAHELGHLVCHPEADPGGTQENQAHAFAAELLMPEDHLRAALPTRFDLGTYARLKHEWGVSIAALLYRARTLEIITDAAYRRAVVSLNAEYGRHREPFPLRQADDPAMLATAMDLAAQSGIDAVRIAREARLTVSDVETIVAGSITRPAVEL
ncbi:MAG: hypothetical protein JWQ43_727 [Glaciihabitans sp.]|nr:hypothetical protein [Glaciihabitans sp.]